MITTDLHSALDELERVLDPDGLAEEILDATGKRIVQYDSESHGGLHRGGWRDQSGELARSYRYEVSGSVLTEENTAPYADEVEARHGISVLTAFDSSEAMNMLHEEAGKVMKGRTI